MNAVKPPFLGAAYYPEDWDPSEIDKDIRKMLSIGIDVARIGEFAWHKMEPAEGSFDFGWLHDVVDRLKSAGIGVVMGTPTATPPIWLTRKYPDMLVEYKNGRTMQHSGRRHACSNHPEYLRYSAIIVEKLAQEFGSDEGIIGWQIDNEIYLQNNEGCYCKNCLAKYREHLKRKFGTVDEMNRRLNMNLFSQMYDSFDEVPLPRDTWENPHLKQEFLISAGEANIAFVALQAEILKKYTKAPIGTDQIPFNGMNYRRLHEPLDVVQFNHYNTPENLWECCLWFDYIRTMKDRPFWNTETTTCFCGSAGTSGDIKPDGFCYANSWLPLALGGEANMYWVWRTHWAGHELVHGSVLDSSGRPMYSTEEVKAVSRDFKKCAEFINSTKVDTAIALHFSSLCYIMFETQPVVGDFRYDASLKEYFYKPLLGAGLRPDVIDEEADLSKYKVVFSPLMLTLDQGGLRESITKWVKDGGIWIAGPMTDIRTKDGTRFTDRLHGMLESLTPAVFKYWFPDKGKNVSGQWTDGEEFGGNIYYELFEPDSEADLALITSGHREIIGCPVLKRYNVGKGSVYVLGTLPDRKAMDRLIDMVCAEAGISCRAVTGDSVIVSPRKGKDTSGVILTDVCGKGGIYRNSKKCREIISGRIFENDITVDPFGVMVLENL
ncbi:MAG: beta-galactosidase [Lachnospiraceae bacterium]|nr:beta-galactosidase [Lachnospiraceae bacterium]